MRLAIATRPELDRADDFFFVDLPFDLLAVALPRFAALAVPRRAEDFLVPFRAPPDERLAVELFFPFADRDADFLAIPESFL